MASFSQTIAVGNLGKDPETRYMNNGDPVCNFSVAVTEKFKGKDGAEREETTWFPVSTYGKLAEICGQYLKKGSSVMVVGRMKERKWTDKEGQERRSWELRADTMQMLGGKPDGQRNEQKPANSASKPEQQQQNKSFDEDDIPF
jgi:single-strand DNA-binding protein